jgi:hypothetical protein
VQAAEQPIIDVYRKAWARVEAQQQALIDQPLQATKARRLVEMLQTIEDTMDEIQTGTARWIQDSLPRAYAAGGTVGATGMGGEFLWTAISQEAVEELAGTMFQELLQATTHVTDTTKSLIRAVAQSEALQKAIEGRTAVQAGREMASLIAKQGIAAVTYRNGARHGLGEYGEMVARTTTAKAYNYGVLNGAAQHGCEFWECFDGPDCGWSAHDSGEQAAGKIVTHQEALAFPISHPNCRRAFGPRPDLGAVAPASDGQGSVTSGQMAAQRVQDQARQARQDRRALRNRQTSTRRAARVPAARVQKRAARLASGPAKTGQRIARKKAASTENATVRAPGFDSADAVKSTVEALPASYRSGYVGKRSGGDYEGDPFLRELNKIQGYDGLPHVVDDDVLSEYVNAGEIELYRGMYTPTRAASRDLNVTEVVYDTEDGRAFSDHYRDGDFFAGLGVYGNGTYSAYGEGARTTASGYASGGEMVRMTLKADARVIEYDDLLRLQNEPAFIGQFDAGELANMGDAGRFATALGYDAIDVSQRGYMVVLNRTATRVSKADVQRAIPVST